MTVEEGLKAREAELLENLSYFLLNYTRLVGLGYRKQVLDGVIEQIRKELELTRADLDKLRAP
jgi:hypothetical protein